MNSYLFLNNLHFHAHHGVMPQEQLVGNEYTINLKVKVDISRAMLSDEVSDTVNYAEVFVCVKEEMNISSKLLEHVAGRIIQRLFNEFPTIESIELRLAKRNPPMNADIDAAGIEVLAERP